MAIPLGQHLPVTAETAEKVLFRLSGNAGHMEISQAPTGIRPGTGSPLAPVPRALPAPRTQAGTSTQPSSPGAESSQLHLGSHQRVLANCNHRDKASSLLFNPSSLPYCPSLVDTEGSSVCALLPQHVIGGDRRVWIAQRSLPQRD